MSFALLKRLWWSEAFGLALSWAILFALAYVALKLFV
jgi:hypothetical protein